MSLLDGHPFSKRWAAERVVHLAGMDKGYYQITNDFISDIIRVRSKAAVPGNNIIYDLFLSLIGLASFLFLFLRAKDLGAC